MDKWGNHAVQCRVGLLVANTVRHKAVRDCLFRLVRGLDVVVHRDPQFPVQVPGLENNRPDISD
jgi:hypothetical protein